tara:strand:+ start:2865 stop:4070 length:1206 start_codon:yes stop_codon:yes gene_type:complete
MKISYGKNVYGKQEINAVIKKLKKTTQMGNAVKEFEKKISKYFSKKYGLLVNSGSSAIILATKLINLKEGDEVITPSLNFGTAVSAIILTGAKPVFVDIKIDSLQIDIKKIERKISKKTKALLIPNLIGNIPDWKNIRKIANKYKLKVIEDSADTLGAKINKRPTGIYSDISITSFYGSHIISCAGNGGMILLNNKADYEKAKVLRSWGRMSSILKNSENIRERLKIKLRGYNYDKKFVFSEIGYNFEPSEIGASFGLVQLKKFKRFNKIRNLNFLSHFNFFKKLSDYFIIPEIQKNVSTNFLAYPVIIKKNFFFNKKSLQIYLENNGIQTRPIFSGNILRHPAFAYLAKSKKEVNEFIQSDYIMSNGILIGCHQGLNKTNISYIHRIFNNFLKKNGIKLK